MRFLPTVLGVVVATSLAASPALALGPGGPKASKPTTTTHKPASVGKATTAKPTTTGKPTTAGKPSTSSKPVKPTTAKATPVKAAPVKTTSTATTSAKSTKHGAGSTTTPTTTTTPSPTTTTLNPIAAKISSKPNLNAKLTAMLPVDPKTGTTMTLNRASLGFKNQGQFIAALHVSQNLGIPFTELKSHMVTVTPGAPGMPPTATQTGSLGQAIQASKASTTTSVPDVPTAVRVAETQANSDLEVAGLVTPKRTTTPKGGVR